MWRAADLYAKEIESNARRMAALEKLSQGTMPPTLWKREFKKKADQVTEAHSNAEVFRVFKRKSSKNLQKHLGLSEAKAPEEMLTWDLVQTAVRDAQIDFEVDNPERVGTNTMAKWSADQGDDDDPLLAMGNGNRDGNNNNKRQQDESSLYPYAERKRNGDCPTWVRFGMCVLNECCPRFHDPMKRWTCEPTEQEKKDHSDPEKQKILGKEYVKGRKIMKERYRENRGMPPKEEWVPKQDNANGAGGAEAIPNFALLDYEPQPLCAIPDPTNVYTVDELLRPDLRPDTAVEFVAMCGDIPIRAFWDSASGNSHFPRILEEQICLQHEKEKAEAILQPDDLKQPRKYQVGNSDTMEGSPRQVNPLMEIPGVSI